MRRAGLRTRSQATARGSRLVHGVNGRRLVPGVVADPLTGEYWPGDAWMQIATRVHTSTSGLCHLMDPGRLQRHESGLRARARAVRLEQDPSTWLLRRLGISTPQTVTKQPPPLQSPTPEQMTPAQQAARTSSNPSLPDRHQRHQQLRRSRRCVPSFELSPKVVIAALVVLVLLTRR